MPKSVRVGIPRVAQSDALSLSGRDPSVADRNLAKLLLMSQNLFGKERRRVLGVWLHDVDYHDPSHYFDEDDDERTVHDTSARKAPRQSDQTLLASMIDRSLSKMLGSGSFGVVGRACLDRDACLALKVSATNGDHEARVLQALGALGACVPRFWGWATVAHPDLPRSKLSVLAMEYIVPWNAGNGEPISDLWDFLNHAPEDLLAKHLSGILRQVRNALRAMRAEFPGARHNDLSPGNVMLTDAAVSAAEAASAAVQPRVVLVDWGMGDLPGTSRLPGVEKLRDYRGAGTSPQETVSEFYDAKTGRTFLSPIKPTAYEHAFVLPYRCDHYDWFYLLFRVKTIVEDRSMAFRVPELYEMIAPYAVPEVLLNPRFLAKVGRLDGAMQIWTQKHLPAP